MITTMCSQWRRQNSERNRFLGTNLKRPALKRTGSATGEDFFLDEIERCSGIPRPFKGIFKSAHGDLYTLQFWNTLLEKLNNGEVFDVIP